MELDFNQLTLISTGRAADSLLACNDTLHERGLILTPEDAVALAERRNEALQSAGRVEFGDPVLSKLALAFSTSPGIDQQNFRETLEELIEIFYLYKTEAMEQLTDDELIHYMKTFFDGSCHGDLELLQSRELEHLARCLRFGGKLGEDEEEMEDDI